MFMFNIQGFQDVKWAYIQEFNRMEKALADRQIQRSNEIEVKANWLGETPEEKYVNSKLIQAFNSYQPSEKYEIIERINRFMEEMLDI